MNQSVDVQLYRHLDKTRLRRNVLLAPYTTMKIGGPAEFYFQAESDEDLIAAVGATLELDLKLTILGGASNVVVPDEGLKGLVVLNRSVYKKVVEDKGDYVFLKVSSGYPMSRLAKETAQSGWSGLEYHLGLPGTVGGAIYMNSKWTQPLSYVGDSLVKAELVDRKGNIKHVKKNYFEFGYDQSRIQSTDEIVLGATFKLTKDDPQKLVLRSQEALIYRKKTQPFGVASSGCFFKNVDGKSVGKMIDDLGLKGYHVGGARVSDLHGNFILNNNNAKAQDVKKVVSHIKDTIHHRYNLDLEEEVVFL